VARSTVEAEYKEKTLVISELIQLKQLKKLTFKESSPIHLICDNQTTLHIASNLVFHERTKHIEVDCYSKEKS